MTFSKLLKEFSSSVPEDVARKKAVNITLNAIPVLVNFLLVVAAAGEQWTLLSVVLPWLVGVSTMQMVTRVRKRGVAFSVGARDFGLIVICLRVVGMALVLACWREMACYHCIEEEAECPKELPCHSAS
ncbi:uncharacterized protein LOC126285103 [Schistocerca gregaria]|uniref:uncharacterized protein LOC126285103 n=1 Tax=Schistocerca gregaria TaxID=7010 RepID=UPI00211F13F1|nr:uncharacterized protein LOC126285103 [Schistocerca gregaria]